MSSVFWIFATLMLGVALAFLLPPLIRTKKNQQGVLREEITVSIYQGQFSELANDLKNGTINQDQYAQAKQDLERNLLSDVGPNDLAAVGLPVRSGKPWIAAAVVGILVPAMALGMYAKIGGGPHALSGNPGMPIEGDVASAEGGPAPVVKAEQHKETIDGMLRQLEEKLAENPDDGESWYMLARSYQFLKRYPEASDAFEKAVKLGGDQSADVLAGYADAVAMAADKKLTDKSIQLLEQALQVDANHVKALWLMGTAKYQNKDLRGALEYWERLFAVLPEGSEEAKQIAANVDELKTTLGVPAGNSSASKPNSMGSAKASASAPAGGGGPVVRGQVNLGGAVAAKADPNDTVFVFARAAKGPKMPLAIVRKQVKDLPFEFALDDSLAMNPAMKISAFDRVIVGARISKAGNALPQPGDLEGFSSEVEVGSTAAVNVTIGSVVR